MGISPSVFCNRGVPATSWADQNPVNEFVLILDDGARGIRIAAEAKHTQLRRNAIHVDGQAIVDESEEPEEDR
jgi:hypothetical protein